MTSFSGGLCSDYIGFARFMCGYTLVENTYIFHISRVLNASVTVIQSGFRRENWSEKAGLVNC